MFIEFDISVGIRRAQSSKPCLEIWNATEILVNETIRDKY